jgi:hypothetical protein
MPKGKRIGPNLPTGGYKSLMRMISGEAPKRRGRPRKNAEFVDAEEFPSSRRRIGPNLPPGGTRALLRLVSGIPKRARRSKEEVAAAKAAKAEEKAAIKAMKAQAKAEKKAFKDAQKEFKKASRQSARAMRMS